MKYKLNFSQKNSICNNIVAFMSSQQELSQETTTFIANWILSDASEKGESYYELWKMVLKNYLPTTRPVLYRSCNRRENGKIASFTGSIHCAQKFSGGKGFLLICDTNDALQFVHLEQCGEYRHTFFPLSDLLRKEAQLPNCRFPKRLIEDYTKEDEYIMQVDLNWMYSCKWYKGRGEQ